MQRNENETFEAYKARRAIANEAVKNINAASKGGKQPNPRVNRPHKGTIGASYGEALRMFFAKKNCAEMALASKTRNLDKMKGEK